MPTITVIIPVLNAMPYLPEALASLEAQTFRDFEVCVWDNGSTDGSAEEARRWIPHRLPGRVVSGNPLPLHECLARMVVEAKTEFVARMDGDDVCFPERFQLQINFLLKNREIRLVGGQIECIDRSGAALPKEAWAEYPLDSHEIISRMMILCPFNHPSILFSRNAVLETGNYKIPAPVEDLDLYFGMVKKHQLSTLHEVVTKYRIHPLSICAQSGKSGTHNLLALDVAARHSKEVFGIEEKVYRRLRDKTHPFCFLPLALGAVQRAEKERVPWIDIVSSPWFLYSARCMASPFDYASKAIFRFLSLAGKNLAKPFALC